MYFCRDLDKSARQMNILQIVCRNSKVKPGGRDHATFSVNKAKTETVSSNDASIATSNQIVAAVKFRA